MAKDLQEQLTRIGHKAELLATRFSSLKQKNAELQERVTQLEAELHLRDTQIEKLKIELEHFKVSSVLAPTSAEAKETRAMISEIVRELDTCIADLMRAV